MDVKKQLPRVNIFLSNKQVSILLKCSALVQNCFDSCGANDADKLAFLPS